MSSAQHRAHAFTFLFEAPGEASVAGAVTGAIHKELGLKAVADPAGMWLRVETEEPMDETQTDRIVQLALGYGLMLRDRIGTSFVRSTSVEQLRSKAQHEWMSRFATGVVFLLPAIALHYLMPVIATGGTAIGHLIEAALVGWAMIAACFPVLVQGAFSLGRLPRVSPDFLASVAMLVPWIAGVVLSVGGRADVPFHASAYAILLVSGQRAVVWRRVDRLDGRAGAMLPTGFVFLVVLVIAVVSMVMDLQAGLAVLLVCPPLLSQLSINRVLHPVGLVMSIMLFAVVLGGARLFVQDATLLSGRIEAAFAFQAGLIVLCGWFAGIKPGRAGVDRARGGHDNPS